MLVAVEAVAMRRCKVGNVKCKTTGLVLAILGVAATVCWMWSRLTVDDSILNRPRIWLAGLQLFAANPSGVGLGNSGTVASAFLLSDIPEIRTMINAHITLLAELGWLVGLAWFAFISLALFGVRYSPRIGISFAGLVVSGCSSTIFDWPVLFDVADFGGRGIMNWILSWAMFLIFVGMGGRLVWKVYMQRGVEGPCRSTMVVVAVVVAVTAVCAVLLVPKGGVPMVHNGYAFRGEAPRTLALYGDGWWPRTVLPRVDGAVVMPVHAVSRFPHDIDFSGIGKVMLFGNCREWLHLVKGVPAACVED